MATAVVAQGHVLVPDSFPPRLEQRRRGTPPSSRGALRTALSLAHRLSGAGAGARLAAGGARQDGPWGVGGDRDF